MVQVSGLTWLVESWKPSVYCQRVTSISKKGSRFAAWASDVSCQ